MLPLTAAVPLYCRIVIFILHAGKQKDFCYCCCCCHIIISIIFASCPAQYWCFINITTAQTISQNKREIIWFPDISLYLFSIPLNLLWILISSHLRVMINKMVIFSILFFCNLFFVVFIVSYSFAWVFLSNISSSEDELDMFTTQLENHSWLINLLQSTRFS